ncbi:MAG: putative oxidoreductase [Microbacteriaceae bacterium]|nr:putative oxidoreductase [Microbacteriaceae bacterium]
MRAPAYGEPEVIEAVEIDVPLPGPGEVRIAVKAAGINPADLKLLRGMFGRNDTAALPLRLGTEATGVVDAVGEGAVGACGPVAVGDEVIAFRIEGGYASRIVVDGSKVIPKPANLDWTQAACLMLGSVTAYHLLEKTRVSAGDRVIVHAASGGVGSMAVQLAVARGAVVVGTGGESNLDIIREAGATPITYGPGLEQRLRSVFPDGADVALDAAGTDEALDASVALVRDRSRIATIAGYRRGAELGIAMLGSMPGGDPGIEVRDAARGPMADLAASGHLRVRVARTYPLAGASEALRALADGASGNAALII